jgi:hypothetical protein
LFSFPPLKLYLKLGSDTNNDMEDCKSESQMKRKDDCKKVSFKQFEFKIYNNYKEYPLFQVLAKKKLYNDGEIEDLDDPVQMCPDNYEDKIPSEYDSDQHADQADMKEASEQHDDLEQQEVGEHEDGDDNEDHDDAEEQDEQEDNEDQEDIDDEEPIEDEDDGNEEPDDIDENEDNEEIEDNEDIHSEAEEHEVADDDLQSDESKDDAKSHTEDRQVENKHDQSVSDEGEGDNKSVEYSEPKEEIRYGKRRFDQVLEDYEALSFEERRKLS